MTSNHPLRRPPRWVQYASADAAKKSHHARVERCIHSGELASSDPLATCDLKGSARTCRAPSVWKCNALCQRAQFRLQEKHLPYIAELLASKGTAPLMVSWVPPRLQRVTLDNFSIEALKKDVSRRLTNVEEKIGRKLMVIGRIDFDYDHPGTFSSFMRVHVHMLVANCPSETLHKEFSAPGKSVLRPLQETLVKDKGALHYVLKNMLQGPPQGSSGTTLFERNRQRPTAMMQHCLDVWMSKHRLIDLIVLRGLRASGKRMRANCP